MVEAERTVEEVGPPASPSFLPPDCSSQLVRPTPEVARLAPGAADRDISLQVVTLHQR